MALGQFVDPGMSEIRVGSPAFAPGEPIPVRHSADGEDLSPPLEWTQGPERTRSYALIVDDPDAPSGTFTHWVAWNLHGNSLPEGATRAGKLPHGARQGLNSWKRTGYGGPKPPSGTHRYFFRIHALDTDLDLPETTGANDLRLAMEGHVIAYGELMGRYTHGTGGQAMGAGQS